MQHVQPITYPPFHHAVPSNDLEKSRQFYKHILGCEEGRTAQGQWIDYNFFGNQLVAHFATSSYVPKVHTFAGLPVPNFGVYLPAAQYADVKQKLSKNNLSFEVIKSTSKGVKQILIVQDFTGNHILFHLPEDK